MNIKYRKEINNMQPYVPGKPIEDVQKELGLKDVIKLASNENPHGCSPMAKEAIKQELDNLAYYPDGNTGRLRSNLSSFLNVDEDQLIFGAGSDEIIGILAEVFLCPGDELLTSDQSFPRYDSAAHLMGAKIVKTPLTNYTYDLNAMKEQVSKKTKLVILANPNNPTATYFTSSSLEDFLDFLPDNVMLVLDEAYYEYVDAKDYPKSLELLEKHSNIIILRTFSKAYGLASLRVGYGIASAEIIELLNRVRNPFNVNSLAQQAAIASLKDQDFVNKAVKLNKEVKEYIYGEFDKLNIEYLPSQANFIMFNAKRPSLELFEALQERGFIIRPAFGVPNWVRVTLGTMEQMEAFIETLKEIY
ncbi:MAG: histidinol-phosphate transaminase [Epulopiscium sp.]|nr:histidinol-phosphate transaminase [Candidatus Epulonipiscium sp.]